MISRRFVPAVLGIASVLATVISCSHSIRGSALYAPDDPHPRSTALIRASDLQSLVLSTAELEVLLKMPDLTQIDLPAVRTLPPEILSDRACGPVLQAGWLATYRVSGFIGAKGLITQNEHENHAEETVAGFRDVGAARAFAGAVVTQWKACIERSVLESAEGYSARWMAFGPSRSYGVDVLLVRREGGRGYACSRGIGAGSNVTADVTVCGPDETVLNAQAASVVAAVLGRIPG